MAGARELKKHTLAEVDRVVVRARAVGGATTLFFILSLPHSARRLFLPSIIVRLMAKLALTMSTLCSSARKIFDRHYTVAD
jgi:hypothetical protein